MLRENVQIVREIFEGWARGDFSTGVDVLGSDFEYQQLSDAVEPGLRRGAGVGRALRGIFEVYEDFRIEAEEYVDVGDVIVVVARTHGVARRSRMQLDQRFAFACSLEEGKLVRIEVYTDRGDALEALGLKR